MTPLTRTEQKTRDLSRVRQNQQRSRNRKRAYVAELEAKIARLLAQDNSEQTVRNENDARRHFLRDLGIADSAQERYIQTHATHVTLTEELSNRIDLVNTTPSFVSGSPEEAVVPSLQVSKPLLESTAIESPPKDLSRPAHPEDEALLFKDSRSLGLLKPLPYLLTMGLSPRNFDMTFDGYGTDGTTACPIAFSMILQNNVRGYSIASLEPKLLVGYQLAGNEGDNCRILNKVLFAVLAEIS